MSASTPVMKTRCAKCLKKRKDWRTGPAPCGEIIRYSRAGYPVLKCPICGHVWTSRSIVGRKMRGKHEREIAQVVIALLGKGDQENGS